MCIPGNIFLIDVDVITGGFIWRYSIPKAKANTKDGIISELIVKTAFL